MTLTARLATQLKADEGLVLHAYQDSEGLWTIGYGRMIDERRGGGITEDEALLLLSNDIATTQASLDRALPWYSTLNEARRGALLNMAFQLGVGSAELGSGLLGFHHALDALRDQQYANAAELFRHSKWAKQTPARCRRLTYQIETGEWQ